MTGALRKPAHPRPVAQSESAPAARLRILEAAASLFEVQGAHGTTIRQIADAARCNSQLIYYYFGDKSGLFRAILEGAAERVAALLAQTESPGGAPRDRLRSFVAGWARVTLAEASAVRLLHRAMLEGDSELVAEIQAHSSAHAIAISALIAEGIKSGDFRADVDLRFAVASLVGMVQYLALAGPILFASTNLKPDDGAALATHTADLFVRGLLFPR